MVVVMVKIRIKVMVKLVNVIVYRVRFCIII